MPNTITLPIVNMNGDRRETLLEQNRTAITTLYAAKEALYAAAPHGRNYQNNADPDAYRNARKEWEARIKALETVIAETQEIYDHLVES